MGGIMDRDKLQRIVEQTHPKKRLVDSDDGQTYEGAADMANVDVSGLSVRTWKKFGDTNADSASGDAPPSARDLRDRFRPRNLTGAGPTRRASDDSEPSRSQPLDDISLTGETGKLKLELLVPKDGAADLDDSHELRVDDDDGIIGESDSGPDQKKD